MQLFSFTEQNSRITIHC